MNYIYISYSIGITIRSEEKPVVLILYLQSCEDIGVLQGDVGLISDLGGFSSSAWSQTSYILIMDLLAIPMTIISILRDNKR